MLVGLYALLALHCRGIAAQERAGHLALQNHYYCDATGEMLYGNDLGWRTPDTNAEGKRAHDIFNIISDETKQKSKCAACKLTLRTLQEMSGDGHRLLSKVVQRMCRARKHTHRFSFLDSMCTNFKQYNTARPLMDHFSFLPDFVNALSEMDVQGLDGEYMCHYIFSGACSKPATPLVDYTAYWPAQAGAVVHAQKRYDNSTPGLTGKEAAKVERRTPGGSSRRRKTFRVLHLSDVHLSLNYTRNAPANCLGLMCCAPDSFQNPLEEFLTAPKYGHWRCDAPPQLLESAVQDCAKQKFAFALFTGDMVDHNPALITRKNTMREEAETLRTIKQYLPDTAIYPVLGNHDSFPYSQEPPPQSPFYHRTIRNIDFMQSIWDEYGWVTGKSSQQVKLTHGGYATEPIAGLKVISLNSNYWYRWNFYNYIGIADPDRSGTVQFLIKELLDCEARGIKAWVQAHVPPGGLSTEALPPQATFLVAALERFSPVISGLFFGHTHHDEFTVMYAHNGTRKSEENALQVVNIGPSITPFSDLNPGWRYYEVDSETFEIMDLVTVYANIEPGFRLPWERTPALEWEKLFSARDLYEDVAQWPAHEPLSAKFWHRVAAQFLVDHQLATDYLRTSYRNSTRAPKDLKPSARADVYCYCTSMTPDQVIQCNRDWHIQEHHVCGIPKFPMPKPVRYMMRNM